MSPTAEASRPEDRLVDELDDHLAEFITKLTREHAEWLWALVLQTKPHLAD
jgi:hypothetical protein